MAKSAIVVNKYLKINMLKIKNISKLGTTVIIQVNVEVLQIYEIQHIVYLKKFSYFFSMDLTIYYHFIIKELAEEFEKIQMCRRKY